jgi:hypothetical protein
VELVGLQAQMKTSDVCPSRRVTSDGLIIIPNSSGLASSSIGCGAVAAAKSGQFTGVEKDIRKEELRMLRGLSRLRWSRRLIQSGEKVHTVNEIQKEGPRLRRRHCIGGKDTIKRTKGGGK